ncbi:MAG TPA: TonB-dependent receptor, partial [Balneola sp.]|nr:TonB-dependent receptor [Balneola sp.]
LLSANVALLETNRGTTTNTLGYFSLTNLEPGTYTIACSYIGFELFRKTVTLSENETLRLDIELEPNIVATEEIVVTSERIIEAQKNIGTQDINTELITSLPKVFEADVFRSIQLLPGVKAASDFSSGLYVRGGSPDQTLILLDRNTVYNPSHFFGFFSTFNPDAIKDVRLYKGGYPAEYGGRLSSVLTIYNKDGNRNRTEGTATLGMLASRVSIEGPYKKGSWMFSARRSTLEPVLAALRSTSDNIPSSFYFLDFNGKVNFDAT